MNNNIYAVCFIYNIKLLLSCGKIPKPFNTTNDQEFMLKVSTFQFAWSYLVLSKWPVESLQYMRVFCKNCIFSGILDQR